LGQLVKSITEDHKKNETDTILYIYDDAGNRTNMLDGDEMTSYTYNGLDQLTKSVTTKNGKTTSNETYVYDANGNEISVTDSVEGTTVTSTYDPADQLATRSETKDGVTVFTQKNEYNGDGQRVSKTDNGIEKLYHYQSGSVAYVTDGSGNKTMQYLSNSGSVIAGEEISSEGSTTYLYNKDIQNSTKSLLKANGDGITAYDYSDFGETTITGDQNVGNEVAYTGGIYDESTGLYYLNARYYDPENGRFLTEDTYRGETDDPDTWHLYAYCNNDPVNYVDPSGHKKTLIGAGIQVSASASVSFLDVGVGIEIIYFFKQIKGVYAYWYKERGTSTSAAKRGMKKMYNLIMKNPSKILSKPSFSCAICAFAVQSEPKNNSVESYTGPFKTKAVGAWGFKGFISTGGGFRTAGAGKSYGNCGLAVSKSYYYYIGNVGKKFDSLKNKIKNKAKRFFDK
jgi:RHS repeat-associated protein